MKLSIVAPIPKCDASVVILNGYLSHKIVRGMMFASLELAKSKALFSTGNDSHEIASLVLVLTLAASNRCNGASTI